MNTKERQVLSKHTPDYIDIYKLGKNFVLLMEYRIPLKIPIITLESLGFKYEKGYLFPDAYIKRIYSNDPGELVSILKSINIDVNSLNLSITQKEVLK